jgi:hypothetical protein
MKCHRSTLWLASLVSATVQAKGMADARAVISLKWDLAIAPMLEDFQEDGNRRDQAGIVRFHVP